MLKMKLIASVMLIVLTTALIGGLTGAWFTDADTAGTATFTAGTLDVDVSDGLTSLEVARLENMAPGEVTNLIEIEIMNNGSKNLAWFGDWVFSAQDPVKDALLDKLYIKTMGIYYEKADGTAWGPDWYSGYNFIENGRGKLVPFTVGDNAGEKAWYDSVANLSPDGVITLRNWNNNAAMVPGTVYEMMGALKPGDNKYVIKVEFGFHQSANNLYQGNATYVSPITVGFNVNATQVNADAVNALNASYPTMGTTHIDWLNDQLDMQP